jgi:uncharacterized OB-fold protein
MSDANAGEVLSARHVLEYDYRRSVGPVLGRFFSELCNGKIVGSKTEAGRVLVPPMEFDPETGKAVDEIVDVGPGGVVETWAWVYQPLRTHPLDHPFAFALIRLDGADTSLLHAVDAGDEGNMATGMRVTPRFAPEPKGSILDIACFEPEASR